VAAGHLHGGHRADLYKGIGNTIVQWLPPRASDVFACVFFRTAHMPKNNQEDNDVRIGSCRQHGEE
jgi:hypothetical protein